MVKSLNFYEQTTMLSQNDVHFPFVLLIVAGVLRLPRRNLIARLRGVLRRTVGSDWGYFTQKMTSTQNVETSVTSKGPQQDSSHPDDQIPQRYATPVFEPFFSGKFVDFFVCFCDEYVLISLCFMSYAYQLIINAINLGLALILQEWDLSHVVLPVEKMIL